MVHWLLEVSATVQLMLVEWTLRGPPLMSVDMTADGRRLESATYVSTLYVSCASLKDAPQQPVSLTMWCLIVATLHCSGMRTTGNRSVTTQAPSIAMGRRQALACELRDS